MLCFLYFLIVHFIFDEEPLCFVFIVLSSFGLLTISKSFILIYIPLLLLLFVILFRKKKKTQLFFYFVSIIILIILSFRGIIESVSLFYSRLFLSEGTTFLTGRDLIWKDYLLFFNENPGVIILVTIQNMD